MIKVILVVIGLLPTEEVSPQIGGTFATAEACQQSARDFYTEANKAGLPVDRFQVACIKVDFSGIKPAGHAI